ncbi:nuclear transport factor 2 family protein [Microbaculum marinum]|uniref:Nuclear transport factor 2 family protein n=1 Tax=Microbaculum marinum TaxID=1764581 RepID=A0AAW9RU34_9HYPH
MNRTDETAAVRAVVSDYIRGTAESDPALLRSVFHEAAVMSGYLGPDLLLGGPEPFFEAVGARKVGPDYSAEITEISVLGRTATATVVEDNLYDLSFVNAFHLLKVDGAWTITSKLFHHD